MAWKISAAGLAKNPYLLAVPITGVTGVSAYSIYANHDLVSAIEDDYLSRVSFTKHTTEHTTEHTIEGQTVSFSDESKLNELIQKDRERLSNFYRNYYSRPIYVNTPTQTPTQDNSNIDFFIHVRERQSTNKNNVWLDNVHLNQLSIDRYGLEYDEKGEKKSSEGGPKLVQIVKWSDIAVSEMSNKSLVNNLPALSFNFYNNSIPKSEIEILMNEDANKYKVEGTTESTSKDWFVWLDKELLTLKLNYALQTWVFNQPGAKSQTQISSVIGDQSSNSQTSSDDQKRKRREAENNYSYLPHSYSQFAKDYISSFLDTSSNGETVSDWGKVMNSVTTPSNFIKTDDLNKIYNRFSASSKSVELFKPHLISKITAGSVGNWKVALDLKKTSTTEDKKPEEPNKEFEAKEIAKIDSNSDSKAKKANAIYVVVDPATNNDVNLSEVLDKVKNYSVRNFSLAYKDSPILSTYSQTSSDKLKEALHVLHIQHQNDFGIYLYEKWLPIILGTIFVTGIICYLAFSFKTPGVLVGAGILASSVNVMGVFFALGAKLSLVGLSAIFVGVFFTLFLGYYFLNFLKKIFGIDFLDKSNIWALFKRGLIMSTDVALPVFVLSSFIAFLAPLDFREFGIVLSLFVLISYVFVSLAGFLITLKFTSDRFSQMSTQFSEPAEAKDVFLSACSECLARKKGVVFSVISLCLIVAAAAGLLFTLGFNSFSFLKNNYLLTFSDGSWALQSGKQANSVGASQVASKLAGSLYKTLDSVGDVKSYLISGTSSLSELNTLLSSNISPGGYSITSTNAFKEWFAVQDVLKTLGFSFALICVYVLIRFKFKNLFIFAFNSILSLALFTSLLLIARIPVTSVVFVSVCAFFTVSIIYHILLFSFDNVDPSFVYAPLLKEINNRLYIKLRFSILWVIIVTIFAIPSSLFMVFWNLSLALVSAHIFVTFMYFLLSQIISQLQIKYSWIRTAISYGVKDLDMRSSGAALHEDYLDEQDEEVILGINKNI